MMDETTLRRLASELLAELPDLIPIEAERAPVTDALQAALTTPEGQGRGPLLDALSDHRTTRAWMSERIEDVVRGVTLDGNPTTPLGLYYVCPEEDEDLLLHTAPAQPPRCPVHDLEMRLEQGRPNA
jgi:hypothetical protein